MAFSDKEKTILSVVGGVASLIIGYLIWRHENAIQAQENAANTQAQNDANAQLVQQLEESSAYGASTPQVYGSTTSVPPVEEDTSGEVDTTGDSDSGIASILSAFFPQGTQSSASSTTPSSGSGSTVTTSPVSGSNPNQPVLNSNPQPILNGATNTLPSAPVASVPKGNGIDQQTLGRPVASVPLPTSRTY